MHNLATMLCTCFLCFYLQYNICGARDTITETTPLMRNGGENISSPGNKFQLGFFTPSGSAHYLGYIGIWYSTHISTVVWVANRQKPLMTEGMFSVEKDGNLKVLDINKTSNYFTSNLSSLEPSQPLTRTAKLLDSGNLVLIDDLTGRTLWQSFDHPTDTFLPGMKMTENLRLISWMDSEKPANGKFTFQKDNDTNNDYIIFRQFQQDHDGITHQKMREYWKSGRNSTSSFNRNKMYEPAVRLLSNLAPFNNMTDEEFNNSRMVMDHSGEIKYLLWNADMNEWYLKWSEPQGNCDTFNTCGDFGSCNVTDGTYDCNCLPGFEPSSFDYWNSRDFYLSGCNRKSNTCGKKSKNDKFLNLKVSKVGNPDLPYFKAESEQACRVRCLDNCSCQAYIYINDSGSGDLDRRHFCWIWTVNITDIQEVNIPDAYDLFIRVREDGSRRKNKTFLLIIVLVCTVVIFGIALFCCVKYISYRRTVTKRRVSINANSAMLVDGSRLVEDITSQDCFRDDVNEGIDVPFYNLVSILAATDNFSDANKLGQGGFGPVYKGKFPEGEIAVKRLSSHSGQGLQEFKNEVVLIAKLQHRNLVNLLGYCTEGNEKILLYEYMPNKSLDAFIFDRKLCILLDWKKRFDIIWGVARGLLYLHQDSRLRVIHRDMKASNILLDEEMAPKISDFGLARIVGGRETESSTNRIVGTYGYMSPEYALEGQFSVKSDVYSFGVVVLEIISGEKSCGFYKSQIAGNLLGYAWSLWKNDKPLALLDQTLEESCNVSEVVKCVIIGLLCVQEDPGDRPDMSKILFMLGSETATLPNPKGPAFFSNKLVPLPTSSSSSTKPELLSKNESLYSSEASR